MPSVALPDKPLISVLMPVYNAGRYVADAIGSILAQTYPHFELIIADDGSTDGSTDIIREYAARDARIRPLFLKHSGVARTLNTGLSSVRGDLIARMDADDVALPHRFAVQWEWMRRTGVDICGSCVKKFGEEDRLTWYPETHTAICHEMLFRVGLLHPTVLMRAAILKTHSYDEQAKLEDHEIFTRLAPLYRMGNVPQVLLKHRCHKQQLRQAQAAALYKDFRKFRRPYFHALFPEASAEDCIAITQVSEKEPFSTPAELERAGAWLVRLARTPDAFLRQRMADRWQAACQRSSRLGLDCYRLYRQIAPGFGIGPDRGVFKLWLTCVLKLSPESATYLFLTRVKRRLTAPTHGRKQAER